MQYTYKFNTNSVGFQHSTYLLNTFLREKTITQVVTSRGFSCPRWRTSSLCLSLSSGISETKHVIKKLAAHVKVTLEVLINEIIKKNIAVFL